jgi:hypothetical protein
VKLNIKPLFHPTEKWNGKNHLLKERGYNLTPNEKEVVFTGLKALMGFSSNNKKVVLMNNICQYVKG